jgi:hypothetical protein
MHNIRNGKATEVLKAEVGSNLVSSCDFIGVKLNEQNTQSRQIKADMY